MSEPPEIFSTPSMPSETPTSSRRDFLATSAGLIASAFLPATLLSGWQQPAQARFARTALLPPIADFGSNPYAQAAMAKLTALLDAEKSRAFPGFSRSTSAFDVGAAAAETLELIRAYNYEDSDLKGRGDCLKAIIARCDCIFSYAAAVRNGDEYGYVAQMAEILLMLTELMPGSVNTARMEEWQSTLATVMEKIHALYSERINLGLPTKLWPSTDVRLLAAIIYSGTVLTLPKYRSLLSTSLHLLEKLTQPDGGVNYCDEQNDCFAYHSVYVTTLARLWQVTGEKAVHDLVAATQWYVPVSAGPGGAAEYYTAPSWKQLWDRSTNVEAAVIIVGLTGNTFNAGHLKNFPTPASLFLASFYKDGVKADSLPENFLFYDQNIKGPRGRNGNYSFAATGRTTLASTRGKSTFVGCMVTAEPDKLPAEAGGYLIDSALAGAAVEVTTNRRVDYNRSTPADLVYLVQRETVSTTANSKIAAVTSHHRISAYQHTASEWFVSEAWLLTHERMVGLLSIHALSDQLGCSINGVLRFVSGCADWGVAKEFAQDGNTFTYGALTARIIEHDFDHIGTTYNNTFNDSARKCGRLVLSSTAPSVRMYPLGTGHYFVCEVHPSRFAPARAISRITDLTGIIGLNVEEANGRTYKLIVNDTSGPVDVKPAFGQLPPGALMISSGDAFRPSYLPPIALARGKAGKPGDHPGLSSVMLGESVDSKSPATKDDNALDARLLLKPYRHKIIMTDPGRRK